MPLIKIPRAKDTTVFKAFAYLGVTFGQPRANISLLSGGNVTVDFSQEPTGVWQTLVDHDGNSAQNVSLAFGIANLTYYRGGQDGKSPVFDEILFDPAGAADEDSIAKRLTCIQYLEKELNAYQSSDISVNYPEYFGELQAMHHSTLTRLAQLNEELISKSADFRERLENEFTDRKIKIEDQYDERRRELEKSFDDKVDALSTREHAIQETLKKIDDRNNTHARREIRDSMLADVKARIQNFGVSKATSSKRFSLWVIFALLISVLCALLFYQFTEVTAYHAKMVSINADTIEGQTKASANFVPNDATRNDWFLYYLWVRISILSALLIATIVYIIRWVNHWAARHADTEFELQRFYLDINRANWIVESCLEWHKETSSTIPTELLNSISNGLFNSEPERTSELKSPADELASALLGSASKLKLKAGENELDIDPAKLKKAAKKEAAE